MRGGFSSSRRIRFAQLESRHMLAYLAGDYSLSGTVNNDDYDVWRANYGNAVVESPVDGNGDRLIDAADYVIWRKNLGRTLADVAPNAPREVEARAVGATSIEVTWQAATHATSYSVQRRQPDTESEFTTIASGIVTTSFTDSTATTNTSYQYRLLAQNTGGTSPASQMAQATANQSNLTAYRPQFRQDPNAPTNGPIYDPWPRTAVAEVDENSNTLGAGIRMNADDDNQNGIRDRFESGVAIPAEDDLIELQVDRLPGLGNLVLVASFDIALYYDHQKATPLPTDINGNYLPLNFTNDQTTVWVEWIGANHGFATVSLVDQATSTTLDSIRYHTFRTLWIVCGGNGQNPVDTDGDGSIGDFVGGGPNREGIFDVAQNSYNTGWNVLPFDEEDVDAFADVPYTVITQAVDWGQVDWFGIMGYSQGGGATHVLIERTFDDGYVPAMGVWVDAVDHDGALEENDWPSEVLYLLNIFEDNDLLLDGGPVTNADERFPGTEYEEVDVTNLGLNHTSIDDSPFVHNLIRIRINSWLPR